jgi:hypothetical protein
MSVATVSANAASQIAGAISRAARSTGISFQYLLATARLESSLNPTAQAPTSSAKGLYQFIEQTWLATVKQAGPAHGLGAYAAAIVQAPDGHYAVPNAAARAAIMRLRDDPAASAMMAGAYARANAAQLAGAIGRSPTEAELYIAHFLGSDGAARLIATAARAPRTDAAAMFPQAAAANRGIFYDGFGRARNAGEVYASLAGRFETARAAAFVPGLRGTIAAPSRAPDTAGTAQAYAQAHDERPPPPDTRPLFEAMFTDRVGVPLDKAMMSLWTPAKAKTPAVPARPLDLYGSGPRDARALFGGKS